MHSWCLEVAQQSINLLVDPKFAFVDQIPSGWLLPPRDSATGEIRLMAWPFPGPEPFPNGSNSPVERIGTSGFLAQFFPTGLSDRAKIRQAPYLLYALDPETAQSVVVAHPQFFCLDQLKHALFHLFHVLLQHRSGFLIHGSGVVIDGAAGIIAGPSGAGKSTAAALLRPDHLLSDDIVAVTRESASGPFIACSTPFGRASDGPAQAPLHALFFPAKAEQFFLKALPRSSAFLRFWQEQFEFTNRVVEVDRDQCFRDMHVLFAAVPVFEMGFRADGISRDQFAKALYRPTASATQTTSARQLVPA